MLKACLQSDLRTDSVYAEERKGPRSHCFYRVTQCQRDKTPKSTCMVFFKVTIIFACHWTKANPLNSYTTLGRRRPACKNGMIQPSITDIFKLKIKF